MMGIFCNTFLIVAHVYALSATEVLEEFSYHKCCPANMYFRNTSGVLSPEDCTSTSEEAVTLFPKIYKYKNNTREYQEMVVSEKSQVNISVGFPVCSKEKKLIPINKNLTKTRNIKPHVMQNGEIHFTQKGKVLIQDDLQSYCVDKMEGEESLLFGEFCMTKISRPQCENKICVPTCRPISSSLIKEILHDSVDSTTELSTYTVGFPKNCKKAYDLKPHESKEDSFHIYSNGSLYISASSAVLETGDYCLEEEKLSENKFALSALVCFPPPSPEAEIDAIHSIVTFVLSLIFLSICILLLCIIPFFQTHSGSRWSLQRLLVLFYCISLFMAFFFLLLVKLTSYYDFGKFGCDFMGILTHYFMLTAFFWMNCLCFKMWRSISSVDSDSLGCSRSLMMYLLYGFGAPAVYVIIAIIIEFSPVDGTAIVKPGYTDIVCFIRQRETELWIYLYGPMLVLIVFNVVLSVLTCLRIRKLFINSESTKSNILWVYLYLFLVMGVTWIMEIVSWQVSEIHKLAPRALWYFTDTINSLQGVFVFIVVVFGCRKHRSDFLEFLQTLCHKASHGKFSIKWNKKKEADSSNSGVEEVTVVDKQGQVI